MIVVSCPLHHLDGAEVLVNVRIPDCCRIFQGRFDCRFVGNMLDWWFTASHVTGNELKELAGFSCYAIDMWIPSQVLADGNDEVLGGLLPLFNMCPCSWYFVIRCFSSTESCWLLDDCALFMIEIQIETSTKMYTPFLIICQSFYFSCAARSSCSVMVTWLYLIRL